MYVYKNIYCRCIIHQLNGPVKITGGTPPPTPLSGNYGPLTAIGELQQQGLADHWRDPHQVVLSRVPVGEGTLIECEFYTLI